MSAMLGHEKERGDCQKSHQNDVRARGEKATSSAVVTGVVHVKLPERRSNSNSLAS
jgi:hypothetical protein